MTRHVSHGKLYLSRQAEACLLSNAVDVLIPWLLASPTDSQENPELIWNDEARKKVAGVVAKMTNE